MSKSKELSEFDRGSIVGCHLCGKSVREITDILQKPKSTVSDVIGKWKRLLSEMAEKRTGISVSSRTVHQELKILGFHGHVAAHKPNITPQNVKHRLQWCRAHRHWTVGMRKTVFFGVMNLALQSGSRMDASTFNGCQANISLVTALCRLLRSIMVWGCFLWFGLGSLVPVIGNMNSEMFVDILDNATLPTLWQCFGEGPFLF
ncbi:transposable element Tcb1 transposase [Trichonephila clavipes]|nr:transposable element Tcb1 transposase [Trichonephila clavipes]